MNLKTLCIATLLSVGSVAATASDKTPTDAVKAADIDVARTDNNLFVKMDLDLSGYSSLNRNREVTVTPMLVNAADTLRLPSLTVAGRSRYYLHLREGQDEWPSPALYKAAKNLTVPYQASVPFSKWMGKAELVLSAKSCGCCGEPIAAADIPAKTLDLTPREKVMFRPLFAFVTPKAELVKHREIKGSAYIDFPVNRTELYPGYRRNPAELAKINATIDSVRLDKDVQFKAMTIKGYASPEGSYSNNVRLAKGRTATLKDYVLGQYSFPASIIATSYEPEDWEGLRRYVENSDIADREGILAIIDSDMEPDPKNEEIRRRYPRQYEFLLKEVYPGLRHSDYTVEYTVRNYTDINEIRHLIFSDPRKLSLNEMFAATSSMNPASPEYEEAFRVAVRMYPENTDANLNAANIEMRAGNLELAERYLDKAGDSPEATYARGVLQGIKGNYSAARALFEKAASGGVKEAGAAIDNLTAIEENDR
ncbi:MAG: DUF3868 domain-containing protein [Muribaculaceae bacterium]|nr:DUF3868 domain-containing protein [Muribaculaceae bacterium]